MIKAESKKWTDIVRQANIQPHRISGAVMQAIDITYLNGPDVGALALTDDEILAAVEGGARARRGSGRR